MSTAVVNPGFVRPRPVSQSGPQATPRPAGALATAKVVPPARLTRRGRLTVTLLFLGLLLAAFTVWGQSSVATKEPGQSLPTRAVVVDEGDTLWGLASEVAPSGDVRAVVHEIEELNALSGASLQIGQELAIPVAP